MGEADRSKLLQQWQVAANRIDEHSRIMEGYGKQLTGQQANINALMANLETLKGLEESLRKDHNYAWTEINDISARRAKTDSRLHTFMSMSFRRRVWWLLTGHVPVIY